MKHWWKIDETLRRTCKHRNAKYSWVRNYALNWERFRGRREHKIRLLTNIFLLADSPDNRFISEIMQVKERGWSSTWKRGSSSGVGRFRGQTSDRARARGTSRWLAARYRANQQSRWRWRHARLGSPRLVGGRAAVFLYSFVVTLAGSVGIRKHARCDRVYVIVRTSWNVTVSNSSRLQSWQYSAFRFWQASTEETAVNLSTFGEPIFSGVWNSEKL